MRGIALQIEDGEVIDVRRMGEDMEDDGVDPEDPHAVAAYFAKKIAEDRSRPGGLVFDVRVEDEEAYARWLKGKQRRGPSLTHLPPVMRMEFENIMREKLEEVGAALKDVEYDQFRWSPKVTWMYQGEECSAHFHLDGEFMEGSEWRLENVDEHSFVTIITKVGPAAARRAARD